MRTLRRQRGVAVVTALLLTTLAVTIVASLFWSQQVQIRSMENQRLQMQTKWVLRGMLDWARRVLREDVRVSNVDHLGEAWAVPMAQQELGDYVDRDADAGAGGTVRLAASIADAQSRFNLSNLARNGVADAQQLAAFRRLLALLQLGPGLADAALAQVLATQTPLAPNPDAGAGVPAPAGKAATRAALKRIDDLLDAPGFSAAVLDKLRDQVVVLPGPGPVNVNTAGPQVLAAMMGKTVAEAGSLIASRNGAYFKDEADFFNRAAIAPDMRLFSVKSDYFLVSASVAFERGKRDMQALIYRKSTGNTTVKWVREY